MAASITTVTITPNPVNAGNQFIIQVAATFTINFNDIEVMTWDHMSGHTWDEIDTEGGK